MAEKKPKLNKESWVAYMKAAREIHRFKDESMAWKRAIELYRATGNKFDSDCSGCRKRLAEWMEKV